MRFVCIFQETVLLGTVFIKIITKLVNSHNSGSTHLLRSCRIRTSTILYRTSTRMSVNSLPYQPVQCSQFVVEPNAFYATRRAELQCEVVQISLHGSTTSWYLLNLVPGCKNIKIRKLYFEAKSLFLLPETVDEGIGEG